MTSTFADALQALQKQAAEVPPKAIPALLAQCAAIQAALAARMATEVSELGAEPHKPEIERFLTIPQVAEFLAVPTSYAYELARRGLLPATRVANGKYVRVPLSDFQEWLVRLKQNGVDIGLYTVYSNKKDSTKRRSASNDRRRGPTNPKADGTDAGGAGPAVGRDTDQRGQVGAGRGAHPGAHGPAHPASGPGGTRK